MDEWKLIEVEGQAPRLFHVAGDPLERTDVAGLEPGQLAAMQSELAAVREGLRALQSGKEANVDEKTRDQLKSLGYGE